MLVILVLFAQQEEPLVIDLLPGKAQKPYSPADGQVVEVTPPPFIWVPVKGAAAYCGSLHIHPSDPDFVITHENTG
jgi:hypothetical protein